MARGFVRFTFAQTALALMVGCGPHHIQNFTPRERNYSPGNYAQRDPAARPSTGSLFSEAVAGYLEDTRAVRVGDLVLVRIDETADARGQATTNLGRDQSINMGGDFLGLLSGLRRNYPTLDPTQLLNIVTHTGFSGQGNTTRNGELAANVAVRVVREMPNGDLFIEGTKVILINHEEYHLYLSGLIRRTDIGQNNEIPSSRIADAQVEFTGSGDLDDQNHRGWLTRLLDFINPI